MTDKTSTGGLWGGRFHRPIDEQLRQLNDSFSFDQRLAAVDLRGSIAYADALHGAGLIDPGERAAIVEGLGVIAEEFTDGAFVSQEGDEDIHTAVERRLHELIGDVAGKLHTGRSRNDQVATDLRLYLLEAIDNILDRIRFVQREIVAKAEGNLSVVMPGYTHLQPAQPILFSHWLMSFFWKLERDAKRLADARSRTSVCPLGSGALAGNPFDVDRELLATSLGFAKPSENSLDAVEDRDFVAEFLFAAALLQVHLSSLAETLILWSTDAFSFVQLHEGHCTGSSLMPQKRNPDALELIRGKSGRVFGHLSGLMLMLKGLPSGYNKDLQEDKEGVFDVIDTLTVELPIVGSLICRMKVNAAHMASARDCGLLATEVADYLVRKGIPFREAHRVVGEVVREAEAAGLPIDALPLDAYRRIHPAFAADVREVFDVHRAVSRRVSRGGTAPEAVKGQLARARELLASKAPADRATRSSGYGAAH